MAIDTGIEIACADLQASGGIRHILLREWTTGDIVVYASTTGLHSITSIKKAGPAVADWYLFEFRDQTPALTINATKENGSTSFECGLSFTLPRITGAKFHELQDLLTKCMMAIGVTNEGEAFVIGVSEKYENELVNERSQTYANVSTMEGGSGAAYNDDNAITVSLMAKQYELPRQYTGTITYYTSGQKATTS
jgi:hypothetical protein